MKTINTSIFDFPELIKGGFVYVDKTAQLYELAKSNADRIYYLPRPRRVVSVGVNYDPAARMIGAVKTERA